MKIILTTESIAPRDRFRRWRETIIEQVMPLEIAQIGDAPFAGRIEMTQVGGLPIRRIATGGIRTELTQAAIRRAQLGHAVSIALQLAGSIIFSQADRDASVGRGDLVVLDRQHSSLVTPEGGSGLFIEIPLERLEREVGPTKLYSRIRVPAEQATTELTARFFGHLLEVHRAMDAASAERMGSIGVDLLIASIAERLAQDVPRALHGTVVVQRAKAHIEDHLHDPDLKPPELAAAVGVSLRRLQELFHERGQNISDYIWERRTTIAARRLLSSQPGPVPIGLVAHACGFSSQAHFSRRFKEQFGMTPRDYRVAGLRKSLARA